MNLMSKKVKLSTQAQEVLNRHLFLQHILPAGFVSFIPEFDEGIDLIIYRERDNLLFKIQLKSRWTVDKKYFGRDIWVAFPGNEKSKSPWYLMPHDLMVARAPDTFKTSKSWHKGAYSSASLSTKTKSECEEFCITDYIEKMNIIEINKLRVDYATEW